MTSTLILPDTGLELNVIGTKYRGDGFAGGDGLHTVGLYLNGYIGRIFIQGALPLEPTSDDWFNIKMDGDSVSYQQYDTATDGLQVNNFTGNFVWIRAKVDRSYLLSPNPNLVGSVTKIILNN